MTFHGEVKKLWAKVKDRTLKPMDLCVASYLQSHIQTKTGRIEVRTKDIAEDLGLTDSHLTQSMKRLRKEMLLVKGRRGTGYYWMLNPSFWHVGGPRLFQQRAAQFDQLIND